MNPENNTLVVLTPGFPQTEADTTCLPMLQIFVRSLKEQYPGLKIMVLSFQYPYHSNKYTWFGIEVIPFSGRNKGGIQRIFRQRRILTILKNIHRANKMTGLLSFWYGECAVVGKNFADMHHLRHFCWILGQDAKKENKFPRQLHADPGELIALSDFIQLEFEKNHGTRPQQVIPPGIDAKQFNKLPFKKDIDIIAAGSLIALKKYEIIVEVIAELKKQIPGIKAMLAGDGPEKNKLQALIIKHELQSNIMLTGELPHAELLQWMQKSKIFLHPSSYEGFGVVCIEALYAGCRVISFCKPMNLEIEHWQIVNTKSEMTDQVLEILENPGIIYQQSIPYKMEDTVKKLMNLFLQ